MRRFIVFIAAAGLLVCALAPRAASAQDDDDWDVKRDPFDRQVINKYKGLLRSNIGDTAALNKLIRLYKTYRTVDLLVSEYEKVLETDADNFTALAVLGHIWLDQKSHDKALLYYEKAAVVKPKDAVVQIALGDLYRRNNDDAKARAAYEVALANTKSTSIKMQVLRSLADLALAADDIEGAKAFYEQYIKLDPKNVQTRIDLGDALLRYGKHAEAIEIFKDAEKRLKSDPPRRVEVVARLGQAYEAAGDEDKAIEEYRRAMGMVQKTYYLRKTLTERVIDIYRRRQDLGTLIAYHEAEWKSGSRGHFEWDVLARLYEETGDTEKAIEAYNAAVKKANFELDTQRRLITLLENSGREDEALVQYEIVVKVAPGEPRFQLDLAERYWARGMEKKALDLLTKMTARFSGDGGVQAAIADLYTRWGKEDLALDAYVRLVKIEPDDINHLVNLGEQYFARGNKDKAIATWKKIVQSKTAANYARLGEVYAEHDMLDEAIDMYDKAIKLEPKRAETFKGRAGVYARKKLYDKGVVDWETVLKLTGDTAVDRPARREARRAIVGLLKTSNGLAARIATWRTAFFGEAPEVEMGFYLVEAYSRQRQWLEARQVLERILVLAPDDTEAMTELVTVYENNLEYDDAIKLVKKLIELQPNREREYNNKIADLLRDARRDDEALEWDQKALVLNPNDAVAHMRLAAGYEEMQKFDEAIASYERTIELDPRNYKAHFALARLYKFVDKASSAAQLYRAVLKLSSDNEILWKAGKAAIDIEEMTDTLGDLERVVSPLTFTYGHKDVYRRILVQLYSRYVPQLVKRSSRGTAEERAEIQAELERLGSRGLKPLLTALNDDKDVAQQRIAVSVLGYLQNKSAAAPLVRLAKQATATPDTTAKPIGTLVPTLDWDVRVEALVAAGRLGDARTIPDLIELSEHRELAMREAAIFALGRTDSKKALPALYEALDDRRESAQTLACLGLAQIPDKNATPKLIAAIVDTRRHDVSRAACAFALGHLKDHSAVDALIETLANGNGEVQRLSAWALGRIGDDKAIPTLLAAYFSRHDNVRQAVGWALTAIAKNSTVELPVDFGDYPMRDGKYHPGSAVRALLDDFGDVELVPEIIVGHTNEVAAGLHDALGRHRDLLVRVLMDLDSLPDHISLGPLTGELSKVADADRVKITDALDQIGLALVADLEALSKHRDTKVRSLAVSVMSKIDSPKTVELLVAGIGDKELSVRIASMEAAAVYVAIRGNADPVLVQALTAQLGSDDWRGRRDAAHALGAFGADSDEAALIKALADDNGYVREEAAKSLGLLGRASSVPALIGSSKDELAKVREASAASLAAIGGSRAAERLAEMAASDLDEAVRQAAGGAKK